MATAITQSNALQSNKGLILEIGVNMGRDFGAIVMPFATLGAPSITDACPDLVNAAVGSLNGNLAPCMSSDASIVFCSAIGMVHGLYIPYRTDFAIGNLPGTRGAGLASANCAGCCLYYCSNNAPAPKARMQIGKMFVPGLCIDDLDVDFIDPVVVAAIENLAAVAANGIIGALNTWYRTGAARRETGKTLPQVVQVEADDIVATQRRRVQRVGS